MKPISIVPINKEINIYFKGDKVSLPTDVRSKIDKNWERITKDYPLLFNGEAFTITSIDETPTRMDVQLAITDYAHKLYSRHTGIVDKYSYKEIFPATLIVTKDNKIIIGKMGFHTSSPGAFQLSAGGLDLEDVENGVINLEHNVIKELSEEVGIDANDRSISSKLKIKYLKTGGSIGRITVIYLLKLKMTSKQFEEHYNRFTEELQSKGELPEFQKVFTVNIDKKSIEDFISMYEDNFKDYIHPLLDVLIAN